MRSLQSPGAALALVGVLMLLGASFGAVGDGRGEDPSRERAFERERQAMVEHQIAARGVDDEHVLAAMRRVPRHAFVPEEGRRSAYEDRPLPIGWEQTISQPYIVALMTAALDLQGHERVLEIGTGSGYQAAVLAEIVPEVYSIEIVPELAARARTTLQQLGYGRVQVRCGDGYRGWPEAAPFDAIIVTASPEHVPEPLVQQLRPGGRMVLPVGGGRQMLLRLVRTERGVDSDTLAAVRFVPMTGEAMEKK